MTMHSTDELKRLFRDAADIASVVPETMHAAAFGVAVEILVKRPPDKDRGSRLSEPRKHDSGISRLPPASVSGGDAHGDAVGRLIRSLDRTRYPAIRSDRKAIDLALLLLRAARDDAGIDGLTPAEVTKVLVEKFRVPVMESSIRMGLMRAKTFVNDVPRGNAKVYRIMQAGEKHIDSLT